MHLVILAAGRATRMLPIHQNVYPKILVNLGNDVQIQKMLNAYPLAETKTIVVDTAKDVVKVQEMLNALNIENVNIVEFGYGATGTLHTVRVLIEENKIPTTNVLLSWSDICPVHRFAGTDFPMDVIFTDTNRRHRMHFQHGEVTEKTSGNMPGLYYFKDLNSIISKSPAPYEYGNSSLDIANALMHSNLSNTVEIELDFFDVGDVEKYEEYLQNVSIEQRFFNDIDLQENHVTKTALNSQGEKVISSEIKFYEMLEEKSIHESFPKLIDSNDTKTSFTIERVKSRTVHQHLKWLDDDKYSMSLSHYMELFEASISKLHDIKAPSSISRDQINAAIRNEYLEVTKERFAKIENILPTIECVNNVDVFHDKVFDYIEKRVEAMITELPEFCLIHGDPNSSNCFVGNTMKFIDPRGQFGGIKFYGDSKYDYAKFIYGLSGYDHFNLTKDARFSYDSNSREIQYDCIRGYDIDTLTTDKDVKFLIALIWLKLPYYTINNINKAIIAYAHGLQLLTKMMNEDKETI